MLLNRQYVAIHVVDVRRAFILLMRRLAEVIHIEDGQWGNHDFESWREVSELQAEFKEPHQDWIRRPSTSRSRCRGCCGCCTTTACRKQRVRLNRRNIFARDGNHCQYCGKRFATSELSLDHIVPTCRGGETSWENLVCACVKCNVRKGGRTPGEAGMKLIKPPDRDRRPARCLTVKLGSPKYASWKTFLDNAYWSVDLR